MGMDVYGRKPDNDTGKYFRNNVWWWRPLAQYVCEVAPTLTQKCQYWHTNDGDGLGKKDSLKLAAVLRAEIAAGRTQDYESSRKSKLDALPDLPCEFCDGTGTRKDMVVPGGCNACRGTGKVRPFETSYPFETANVSEFCDFLEHCGGFKIC